MLKNTRRAIAVAVAASVALTLPAGASAKPTHTKKPSAAALAKQRKLLLRRLAEVATYNGPTGTIVHLKSKTTDPNGPQDLNWVSTEAWVELGGGQRYRAVVQDLNGTGTTQTQWGSPQFSATLTSGGTLRSRTVAQLTTPTATPWITAKVNGWQQVPEALLGFNQAPDGGDDDFGHHTREVILAVPSPSVIGSNSYRFDATTRKPVVIDARATAGPGNTQAITLWQPLATSAKAGLLSASVPQNAEARN